MRPFASSTLESWLLTYALNALWQVPIVFAAAWIAARISRRSGPAFQHRLWASALVVEALLPACPLQPFEALRALLHWLSSLTAAAPQTGAQVTVVMGPAQAQGGLHLSPLLLAAIALLYAGSLMYFAARLCFGLYQTASLGRRALPITLSGYASQSVHRFSQLFGVDDAVVAASTEIAGPIILGLRRPILLLPAHLDANILGEDLDAALAHEFAHMRRRDFAKNLLYEFLSLPIAFHPLLWLTRSRMAETRELICDAMAADAVAGRQRYAHSLLRLATKFSEQAHAPTPHAIGIFDAHPFKNFERRVMNLTHKTIEHRGAARFATTALSLLLIAGACTSALAFRLQVTAPPTQTTTAPTKNDQTATTAAAPNKVMHIGGAIKPPVVIHMGEPQYTQQARDAKFSGNILVYLWVDKNGHPSHVRVVKGAGLGLDEKAVEAVRQYQFKPATLDGNPVTVDLYVDVAFRIMGDAPPTQTATSPSTVLIGVPRSSTGQPAQSFKVDIADASSPNPVVKVLTPPFTETAQPQSGSGAHVTAAVMAGNLISHVNPVIPEIAKKAKMNGQVVLHAIIGKDGKMQSLTVASSTNPIFNNSALDAVRQWTYKPYLLNGNPTEVDTTITVNYALND